MQLSATLTEAELSQIVADLIPLRIDLSAEDTPRWLDVVEVLDSELVSDTGFVVAAKAEIHWPERRILETFTVPKIAVLIEPGLESTRAGVGLVVKIRCHDIDLRWVPSFVDSRIVDTINERLRTAGVELRWDLSDALSFEFPSQGSQTNIESIGLDVSDASIAVDGHRVVIEGPMTIRVVQEPPRSLADGEPPLAALPESSAVA